MKINSQEWSKVKGSFTDKKLDSNLKAIPNLYKAFFGDQTATNLTVLTNNIRALEKRIGELRKEKKADKDAVAALKALDKLIVNGNSQIGADRKTHQVGLNAHIKLRDQTYVAFEGHKKEVMKWSKDIDAATGKWKAFAKAKDWENVAAMSEVFLGLVRDGEGIEANMVTTMKPVRVPSGGMKAALKHLSKEAQTKELIPRTSKIFKLNKGLLQVLRAKRDVAAVTAVNAREVAADNRK